METKVRVVLDSSQAKGELRDLEREGQRSAGRVGERVRNSIGRGLGQGVGLAIGAAGVTGALKSGAGDVIGETFGAFAGDVQRYFLGDLPAKAAAASTAREQVIAGYGAFGEEAAKDPNAINYFNQIKAFEEQKQNARSAIEADNNFRSVEFKDVTAKLEESFGKLLSDAVDLLWDKIRGK